MKEKLTVKDIANNYLIHPNKINTRDSLGIPNYGQWYIETKPNQNAREEMIKIHEFIKDVLVSNKIVEFQGKNRRLQFINYGRTQLVYVLTIDENRQYTLLVTQPSANKGIGKKILEEQLKENHEKGIRTILQVFKDNPAKKLYEQLGFKVYGETETHYQMEN